MFKVEPGTYKIVHVDFNENTNGLLRQYFPKGMDLSNIHQNRLNAVARRLNERPRETLQFRTPAEKFAQGVASTG
jgi:IS30 family transposase